MPSTTALLVVLPSPVSEEPGRSFVSERYGPQGKPVKTEPRGAGTDGDTRGVGA
jgi:hypothetical protein